MTEREAERVSEQGASGRERLVWLLVFAVPPGIGMTGFVAVALQRGGLTPTAVGVGTLTTLAVAGLVYVTMIRGSETSEESPATR